MTRIGILGGSFNPPHQGHIHISKHSINRLNLKQIWWIPTQQNPLKKIDITANFDKRVEDCQKIASLNNKIKVKIINYKYSVKLITKLKKKYPKFDFVWIMGADNIESFDKWYKFKTFIMTIKIVIVARNKSLNKIRKARCWNFIKKYDPILINQPKNNISSTNIRQNVL